MELPEINENLNNVFIEWKRYFLCDMMIFAVRKEDGEGQSKGHMYDYKKEEVISIGQSKGHMYDYKKEEVISICGGTIETFVDINNKFKVFVIHPAIDAPSKVRFSVLGIGVYDSGRVGYYNVVDKLGDDDDVLMQLNAAPLMASDVSRGDLLSKTCRAEDVKKLVIELVRATQKLDRRIYGEDYDLTVNALTLF